MNYTVELIANLLPAGDKQAWEHIEELRKFLMRLFSCRNLKKYQLSGKIMWFLYKSLKLSLAWASHSCVNADVGLMPEKFKVFLKAILITTIS
ncbi:hypothetical protein ACN0IV_11435 [Trabulsiella odontotermitis]|uniref:hypothetical protein n=1 Tax=Trabulsiella odontotermitis TaxID=379893 RepID=UPI003AD2C83C